jgi:hypothetical protein
METKRQAVKIIFTVFLNKHIHIVILEISLIYIKEQQN